MMSELEKRISDKRLEQAKLILIEAKIQNGINAKDEKIRIILDKTAIAIKKPPNHLNK
jgi:hypothetical protein